VTLGWGRLAAGGVEIEVVPGNHYTMLRKPHVEAVGECLTTCLDEAQAALVRLKAAEFPGGDEE
jgi:thioesterase domain-containing protein